MTFKTSAEYLATIRKQRPVVYVGGQRVPDRAAYEPFAPTLQCWGTWIYDCVKDPEVQKTLERTVSVDGKPCHPFWAFPRTREELLDNILVARQVSRVSPAAGYATIGRDLLAALYVVAWAMKRDGKEHPFERVLGYARRFQTAQIMTAAAITDPKGDRRLRPAEQPNREAYLRVVDRRADGIVVRGCKMHTSGSVAAEELIVSPTRAMRKEDADYAVAFAIPVDTSGVKLIAAPSITSGTPRRRLSRAKTSSWRASRSSRMSSSPGSVSSCAGTGSTRATSPTSSPTSTARGTWGPTSASSTSSSAPRTASRPSTGSPTPPTSATRSPS